MTSSGSQTLLLLLLLIGLPFSRHPTAVGSCVESWSGRWNNALETTTESYAIGTARNATDVFLSGRETADELNISDYFEVSINGSDVVLKPRPALRGVRDYPVNEKRIGTGSVFVNCPDSVEELSVSVTVVDSNTAAPRQVYLTEVPETFPVNVPIPSLYIGAADYDGDVSNNQVSFSLEDPSNTFVLTAAAQTLTRPATYSARLMLTRSLDWSQQSQYRLTVTSTDRGGLKTVSDVIIMVLEAEADSKVADQLTTGSEVMSDARSKAARRSKVAGDSGAGAAPRSEVAANAGPAERKTLPSLPGAELGGGCVDTTAVKTRLYENTTVPMIIKTAPTALSVSLSGNALDGAFNLSDYFTVTLSNGQVLLNPIQPDLSGVRDYPVGKSVGRANCTVTCTDVEDMFPIQVNLLDSNTAGPVMSQATYTAEVLECMLINTTVPGLFVNASDYDGDAKNNNLTFSMEDPSGTFVLTPPEKTDSWPMSFSVQLVSARTLDWSQQSQYRLTVTAADPGGMTASSDVIITVLDADNKAPQFKHSAYTVEALDGEVLEPLTVYPEAISAFDPDIGGPLSYSLIDLPGANWSRHFHLDPASAQLSLARELSTSPTLPADIALIVECAETRGARFSARTVLVVRPQREHLPALLAIQSLEEETTAEADSENGEKTLGAKKLAPRNGSKLSEETQKGGAN